MSKQLALKELLKLVNLTRVEDEDGDMITLGTVHNIVTTGNPLEIFGEDTIEYRPQRPTNPLLTATGATTMTLTFTIVSGVTALSSYIIDFYKLSATGVRTYVLKGVNPTSISGTTATRNITGLTAGEFYQAEIRSLSGTAPNQVPSLPVRSLRVQTSVSAQTWAQLITGSGHNVIWCFNVQGTPAADGADIPSVVGSYTMVNEPTGGNNAAIVGGNLYGTGNVVRTDTNGQGLTMRGLNSTLSQHQLDADTKGFVVHLGIKGNTSFGGRRGFAFIDDASITERFRIETAASDVGVTPAAGRMTLRWELPGATVEFPNITRTITSPYVFDNVWHKLSFHFYNGVSTTIMDGVIINQENCNKFTIHEFERVGWLCNISSGNVTETTLFADSDLFTLIQGTGGGAGIPTVAQIINQHVTAVAES
jgi:hypothetical protein